MKKENQKYFILAAGLLAAFALWTAAVRLVDVQAIGPQGTSVGFAALNSAFHRFTGVHMELYTLTDWLGLIPIAVTFGFAVLGLVQWCKRKRLQRVDWSLFVLGGFYLAVMAAYLLFEMVPVNYRPVLIEGIAEVSYPSSTTLLVLCVMPTALLQLHERIKNNIFNRIVKVLITAFVAFMVIGRLISGVHWLSDIIGGILLSAGLVLLYVAVCKCKTKKTVH